MSYAQNFTSVKKRFHKSKLPSTMEIWDKEMVNSFVLILKVTPWCNIILDDTLVTPVLGQNIIEMDK